MRKLAPLLALSLLLLPGCILAVHDGAWDDEGQPSYESRFAQLDRRVRDLEQGLATCTAECCQTKDAKAHDAKGPQAQVQEIHAPAGSR